MGPFLDYPLPSNLSQHSSFQDSLNPSLFNSGTFSLFSIHYFSYEVELCLSKRYADVQACGPCECDLVSKQGLRCHQIEIIGMGHNNMAGVLTRETCLMKTKTQGRRGPHENQAETGVMLPQARNS